MLAQTRDTQYSRQRPLSMNVDEIEQIMSRQMQLRQELQRSRDAGDVVDAVRDERITESIFFQDYLRREEVIPNEQTLRPRDERTPGEDQPDTDVPAEQPDTPLTEGLLEPEDNAIDHQPRTSGDKSAETQETAEEPLIGEMDRAAAAALLSRYGTFENLAAARLAEYRAAGEALLKEGRFYKAADMFALAAMWDPKDARPWAGQAFALFAAGEYMSSAFYLSQAIVRNPDVASQRVNLPALIGDRDVFENRVIEMTTWQERSGSGELAFMMAFVHYHDGRTVPASEAIQTAAEKMPGDKAVRILRNVILSGN
jgi:Flp pilus assembly protein TadD